MRSVRGNIHQGQVQCRGQGFQCTIIAVTALLGFYCGQLDLLNLHANSVDRIVYSGSKLYDEVVQSSPRYLEHREIPTNIEIFNNDFYLEVYSELFYGVIGQHGNPIAQSYSIEMAIENAFQMSNFHVFTAGGTTISIFANGNSVYVFDSHARDAAGNVCFNHGTAVILNFESIMELVQYLSTFYANLEYNLSPVSIRIEQGAVQIPAVNQGYVSMAFNSCSQMSYLNHSYTVTDKPNSMPNNNVKTQKGFDHSHRHFLTEVNMNTDETSLRNFSDLQSNCISTTNNLQTSKSALYNHSYCIKTCNDVENIQNDDLSNEEVSDLASISYTCSQNCERFIQVC